MMPYRLRRFFDNQRPHLLAALRGTAAALAALAAAELLGLACPYWAAMTALIVIQPTRGLLLEKSFYRLVGTVVGSAAGLLLLLGTKSPLLLIAGLCLWLALCVGVGNLLYGLGSYAALMAGCTCVVIAMSGYHNQQHLYDMAFSRVACILIGIVLATAVTAVFTPRQSQAEPLKRLERLIAACISWWVLLLRQGRGDDSVRREQDILIEVAEIETALDAQGAGSLRCKRQTRQMRSFVASLLSMLALGRLAAEQLARQDQADCHGRQWRGRLARRLEEIAVDGLSGSGLWQCTAGITAIAAEAKPRLPLFGEVLLEMASLQQLLRQCGPLTDGRPEQPVNRLLRHRDWRQACRAAVRAALAIGAVGVTWALSGWVQGPLMLMATSIMIAIFSTKEHPAAFIAKIFVGAATGSVLAVICSTALLRGVTDPLLAGAIIAPFIFAGVFAMRQRRTATSATDATMFFIFVTQPGASVAIVPHDLALGAVAMVMGVASAWIAYRYLVPINPAIRLRSLLDAIMADLEVLARLDTLRAAAKLQARMQHRVIRLVALADGYHADRLSVVEGGIAALALARSVQRLREQLNSGEGACARERMVREALRSLSDLRCRPGDPAEVLRKEADRFYAVLLPPIEGEGALRPGKKAAVPLRNLQTAVA
jgi:uncharacterized membrane protein YccC